MGAFIYFAVEETGPEKLYHLPKITQLVSNRGTIQTQACLTLIPGIFKMFYLYQMFFYIRKVIRVH